MKKEKKEKIIGYGIGILLGCLYFFFTIDLKFTVDGIEYEVTNRITRTCKPISAKYVSGDLVIPSSVSFLGFDFDVKSIGYKAFARNKELTFLVISEGVECIEESAFEFCTSLRNVKLPKSLINIEAGGFFACSALTSIYIPENVRTIGERALGGLNSLYRFTVAKNNPFLTTVNGLLLNKEKTTLIAVPQRMSDYVMIPNGVTTIESFAFHNCSSLRFVYFPKSVKTIGSMVFSACRELTEFIVADNNPYYTTVNGLLYNKEKTILLATPGGLRNVSIPFGVECIGNNAFFCCYNLSSVSIPSSVKLIGDGAFYCCRGLTEVVIPKGVIDIGFRVFEGCEKLQSVSIPESVRKIGYSPFERCPALSAIYCYASVPPIVGKRDKDKALGLNDTDTHIYIPVGTKKKYMKAKVWKDCTNFVERNFYPSVLDAE